MLLYRNRYKLSGVFPIKQKNGTEAFSWWSTCFQMTPHRFSRNSCKAQTQQLTSNEVVVRD